jgi:hypothetical protein
MIMFFLIFDAKRLFDSAVSSPSQGAFYDIM